MKWTGFFAIALLCCAPVQAGELRYIAPEALQYKSDPAVPGLGLAVIAGDPRSAGPYTVRGHFPPQARTPPHRHPDERVVTVLSGVYWFGVGERFDETALRACPPGTVVIVPAGVAHYSAAKEIETVIQESGMGPTAIVPIAP